MKIERKTLTIPTYAWDKTDSEPPFIREFTPRSQPIYPYSTQETVSTGKRPRDYEAIIFENNYLKVTFLPELNGRIYSAYDKINRRELFYSNPVIKPCLFGLRGAWAAVGVEYNFPNSHSTTTLERIPYQIIEHEDGSASFVCGNIERVSGMGWSVEVILPPDKAALNMISRLQNFTEFPQRFYYWINAAVPIYPESRYIYPPSTRRLYTHPPMDISSLGYIDYPIHDGRDISIYKNVTRHFPVFAETMNEDFFGIYHHDYDCGLVHVADHSLVRGRKLWMFGNAHDGKIWLERLAEHRVDYCELQTGPFSLQSDYRMLQPGQTHVQHDTWFPVGSIGGFNAASQNIAANIKMDESGQCSLQFSSIKHFDNAELVIRNESRKIVTQNLHAIKPLESQTIKLVLPKDIINEDLVVEIIDSDGQQILEYVKTSVQAKTENNIPPKINSGLNNNHEMAYYNEQQGYADKALQLYSEDADKNIASKIAAGRLMAKQGLVSEALKILLDALRVEHCNAKGHYYAGICCRKLGKYDLAEKHFSQAIDDAYWACNAKFQLSLISICQMKYSAAISRFEQIAMHHQPTSQVLAFYAMALRKAGFEEQSKITLSKAAQRFQFDPLVSGELFLHEKNRVAHSSIVNCLNDQHLLDIICRYLDVRQFSDAEAIILFYLYTRGDNSINPLLYYYLGYIQNCIGKTGESLKAYKTAQNAIGTLEGASRLESETVLRAAIKNNPQDSTALFQLGNLLASRSRWREAIELWANVTGQYRLLALRAQGLYWWKIMQNTEKALPFFRAACNSDGCGAKTIWENDHLLEELGMHEERLKVLTQHEATVLTDNRLLLRKASALIMAAQSQKGLDILLKYDFALCEGKMLPRILFEKSCSQLAMNKLNEKDLCGALAFYQRLLEYPDNLGVGKPALNSEARWWWHCGKILEMQGDTETARRYFSNGSQDGEGIRIDFFPLQNVVLQHGPDSIDIAFWTNEFFKALCSYEAGDKSMFKQRIKTIEQFVTQKSADGRSDEASIMLLNDYLLSWSSELRLF